jgi:probable F420-dependent oxidoreductase
MRAFRFGVLIEQFPSPGQVLETARRAEAAGYSTLLIRDHYVAEPFGDQYAPLATLAALSQITHRIRLGGLVFNVDYRHPAELAKQIATIDQLSGGRVEVGLGAGFLAEEYAAVDVPYLPNAERVARFEDTVQRIDRLLRSVDPNFPTCVQRPRPPIIVGAGGRRMLSIGARCADGVAILPTPIATGVFRDSSRRRLMDSFQQQVGYLEQAGGERFDQLELCVIATEMLITNERRAAAEQLMHARGWTDVSVEEVLAMPSVLIGTVAQIADHLQAVREQAYVSYVVVPDRRFETFVPVVEQLSGA